MNHRIFLQHSIIAVIAILIVWSIVNVATYAYIYHASWIVSTLGIAVGAANAISVYAFVIGGRAVRSPAGVGILLFGGASGTLQMLLYLHDGAPVAAAIPFGWIGPVAEGVLSWLHAALSEDATQDRKPQRKITPQERNARPQTATQEVAQERNARPQTATQSALPFALLEIYNMQQNGMTLAEIAAAKNISERTVSNRLKQAKAQMNGHNLEVAQ